MNESDIMTYAASNESAKIHFYMRPDCKKILKLFYLQTAKDQTAFDVQYF